MHSRPSPPEGDDTAADLLPTFAACLLVLLAGLALLYVATDRASAFTTESLRRREVARHAVDVPDFAVVDAQGRGQSLHAVLGQGGKVWIVDFIYTRCATLCLSLGSEFQQLQAQIEARGLKQRVGLLSISFDPVGDGPDELKSYSQRMRMQPEVWQAVTLRNAADRRELLDAFGIMVVPVRPGEFEHNAALHLIDRAARLVQIVDLAEPAVALDAAAGL